MTPRTLDDLATRTPSGKFSDLTAELTATRNEGVTLATHWGKFYSSQHTVEAFIDKGVCFCEWEERKAAMAKSNTAWCILRRMPAPTHHQRLTAMTVMDQQTGRAAGFDALEYSKPELVLQALDHKLEDLTGRQSFFFRRLGNLVPGKVICSKSSAMIDTAVGMLPKRAEYMAPDGLWDLKYGGQLGHSYGIVDASAEWLALMRAANVPIRRHPDCNGQEKST